MHTPETQSFSAIPANKFYPPHIDPHHSLFRAGLFDTILSENEQNSKIIAIEAQAGQGKTTLAYQYVTHYRHSYIWYQIGKEDSDPVLLLGSLLHSLQTALPGFSSEQLEAILLRGEIGAADLIRCSNVLLADLDFFLQHRFYIVFDDLHLIADAELTNQLIAYLLDTSPPLVHFILTSRHPFELKSKTIRNRKAVIYLNTQDLALNSREIEELFNEVFYKSISMGEARKIEALTGGWVMGIVLAAHPMSGGRLSEDTFLPDFQFSRSPSQKEMLEYFQEEIFGKIPGELHIVMLKLSFLDEIHVDLAHRLTGVADIDIVLLEFTQENLFIYALDNAYNVFRFHHLFQEFLQVRARKLLDKATILAIYAEAAAYFQECGQIAKTLSCYLQGGQFDQMEALLRRCGVDLIARNKTLTILATLRSIPEKTLLQYRWLALFSGILETDYQPERTLPHLEAGRILFREKGEGVGELLALATIVYYHFVVSGCYRKGASLLPRMVQLFTANRQELSHPVTVMVTRSLAAGYCFFSADMKKARFYINEAVRVAFANGIRNFMASTLFIKAYLELLSGEWPAFRQNVEQLQSLTNDPLVGRANKLSLRILHLCSLSMAGDDINFFHQLRHIQENINEKLIRQTVVAPYFYIWSCSCCVSRGETEKALEILNRGVEVSHTARSDHMLSQLLQWQAFIHALHGNIASAEVKINESRQLREAAGGPFYQAFNAIMSGVVFSLLERKEEAEEAFSVALELAETIPSSYLIACCLMQRSAFRYRSYGEQAALADLREALALMSVRGFEHFWSWTPKTMLPLLALAVKNGVARETAGRIAASRCAVAIKGDGTFQPLLNITVLDGFHLRMKDAPTVTVDQLTPMQRDLLCLILFAKGKRIKQEKVQHLLWPDSSPRKSRKKLDTLLGRLRTTLENTLGIRSRDYLILRKGILGLELITSDVEDFLRHCQHGFRHAKRGENWQAGNHFQRAFALWRGTVPTDFFSNDAACFCEDSLLATYEEMVLCWSSLLNSAGRTRDAIPLVLQLLQKNPLSEPGVEKLCNLYVAAGQPLKIRQTLDRYRQALETMDFTASEIEETMETVCSLVASRA